MSDIFSSVEDIINEAKRGKIFIITDDESRENEGDLVFAADFADAKKINFLITFGRGLVCMPISSKIAKKLELPLMTKDGKNTSKFATNFTVSVGAKSLTTTGISAMDRAVTLKTIVDKASTPSDISIPGHIFALIANDDGVLKREGHTEASVEICKLAGLSLAAVICEILDEDGQPARLPYLTKFGKQHNLKITSVKKIKDYVLHNTKQP